MKSNLYKQYKDLVIPKLKEDFGYKNDMSVPRIEKVTLNVGVGKSLKDEKFLETVESTLTRITGQKPVRTKARKSIASFKIREGMVVGSKVVLHGERMYNFLEKLVNVTFPRVRDFRGISDKTVDNNGNFSYGFRENLAFPEINPDEVDTLHGLEVNITTSASNREEGLKLFKYLGFPFKANK